MTDAQLTGAELLCEALLAAQVNVIFGIPGGAIMPFYHALPEYPALRHVLCRHEQGAGHAAQGYARATGRIGVCVATSGPGATNLVTPIADAWMDGTPLLAITGQVTSALLGTDAFQETDIIGITLPVVKHSVLVTRAEDIPEAVRTAIAIALGGRPGPVLVDVTKDAQQGRVARPSVSQPAPRTTTRSPEASALARAAAALAAANRPLLLAGQGVLLSDAADALVDLAEWLDLPVATTLLGLGAIPEDHPLSLGMAGMHGESAVNRGLQRCDVLLGIGARFDDRVTGRTDRFAPHATIIHADIEPAQIGKTVRSAIDLTGDAAETIAALRAVVPRGKNADWRQWLEAASNGRSRADRIDPRAVTDFPPAIVYQALDAHLQWSPGTRVVTDVGQHQMWAAQAITWRRPGMHVTSGGAGTMGFAIPAALGVAIAHPDDTVWAIVGDGGFQMTNQELATVVQEGIRNLRVAIINNGYLGMVRQWQELFHGRRYSGTPLSGPDFALLGRAYGLPALVVDRPDQVEAAIAAADQMTDSVVIDFRVEREANVFPIVPPGVAIDAMLEQAEVVS